MNDDSEASLIIKKIASKESSFWEKESKKRALALFHRAAREVPAYKDFLHKNSIQHEKIKTFKDFQLVPVVNKENYLRLYPLEKLAWGGSLKKNLVFTSTSGSTGKPFYFPRSTRLDWEGSLIHEMFLRNGPNPKTGPTLVLICFGMGVWIGGLLSYKGYEIAAQRAGFSISILTPGINKKEIFNALRMLAPQFSQTILVGYAPFIKDILDSAESEGIDIASLHLRLSFAAEAFTENFRDYLVKAGKLKDPCLDTINIYGSADIGAMGFETPLSIFIRRVASGDQSHRLWNLLFKETTKTPTLAQYNPLFITFEEVDGELLLTGDNSIPLIRYAIGDRGGVLTSTEMKQKIKEYGTSIEKIPGGKSIAKNASELPFVYVYERTDFSTTLYGLQIYPEHIRDSLIHASVSKFLTGKFTMATKFDGKQDQYLELNIEMLGKTMISQEAKKMLLENIVMGIEKSNSEFRELRRNLGKRALPRLVFWPAEHEKYFRPGIKQEWLEKVNMSITIKK